MCLGSLNMRDNEIGRSMIEMLGVLAIVGILSVGGIAGFSKAMMKYKLNKLTEEYTLFINEFLRYEKDWIKEKMQLSPNEHFYLTSYVTQLGIIPQGWSHSGSYIYDSMGNRMNVSIRHEQNDSGIRHNKPMISYSIKKQDQEDNEVLMCQNFFVNIAKPYSNIITAVHVWGSDSDGDENASLMWYGDSYCYGNRNCVRYATISQIYDSCISCVKEGSSCVLLIGFE
ncbi:MAG: hypothetical protein NC218_06205 [Acetobacter sp.]|nr:hypothetical protein [Acetobacter sp.]